MRFLVRRSILSPFANCAFELECCAHSRLEFRRVKIEIGVVAAEGMRLEVLDVKLLFAPAFPIDIVIGRNAAVRLDPKLAHADDPREEIADPNRSLHSHDVGLAPQSMTLQATMNLGAPQGVMRDQRSRVTPGDELAQFGQRLAGGNL